MSHKDYSATPLWRKLGLREGASFSVARDPGHFMSLIDDRPPTALVARGQTDVQIAFAQTATELSRAVAGALPRMPADGALWIVWLKKSSPLMAKIDFDTVHQCGLAAGLVDNKTCSVDSDWQAVRFVVPKASRANWRATQ